MPIYITSGSKTGAVSGVSILESADISFADLVLRYFYRQAAANQMTRRIIYMTGLKKAQMRDRHFPMAAAFFSGLIDT